MAREKRSRRSSATSIAIWTYAVVEGIAIAFALWYG